MAFHKIKLVNSSGACIFQGAICFLDISEEAVLKKGIEYYEGTICTIRKESLRRIVCMELEELLLEDAKGNEKEEGRNLPEAAINLLGYGKKDLRYCFLED